MKVGLQLHTVRNELKADYAGTMQALGEIGVKYIEGGLSLSDEQQAAIDAAGIQHVSGGGPLPIGDEAEQHLQKAKDKGFSRYVVFAPQNWQDDFKDTDSIKAYCVLLKEGVQRAKDAGLQLCYHNHWFEAEDYDGKRGYQIMREEVGDDLAFEIDTYWAAVGGSDPAAMLDELGDTVPLIHIKDGPADSRESIMCPLGLGKLPIPTIVDHARYAEYAFIELDTTDRDVLESVKISHDYLQSLV